MDQFEQNDEINLWEYIEVLWKRKWLIIIPTFVLILIVGIHSFLRTPVWEIDAILQPSKFLTQTQDGKFEEVFVSDPKQIAGAINQASYNSLIASETNIDPKKMPKLQAENLRDTKLIRVWVRESNTDQAKRMLEALFGHLQSELNRKIDVEVQEIDTQISTNENAIKQSELAVIDKLNEIKLLGIQKTKTRQEIDTEENKLKISEQRAQEIAAEMKSVKNRIDEFDERWKKALSEQKQGADAVLMLLYSSEAQTNYRYMNSLDENLSKESITQETLQLSVKSKNENIKELDAQIEKQKNEIEKIKTSTKNIKQQIELFKGRKARIDYAQWIKLPTPSPYPVAPNKKMNVLIAGLIGLFSTCIISFSIEYFDKKKNLINQKTNKKKDSV